MKIHIELTAGTIAPTPKLPKECEGRAGAVVEFLGLVRAQEQGRRIEALEYEAHRPMARRVMRSLLEELAGRHKCLYVRVTHRLGRVPVGQAALHALVASRHRAEGLALLEAFIDRLKQDVPIWKRPVHGRENASA